jgi:NAD+ kinase
MERVGVLVHPTRPVHDALEVLKSWTAERGLELVQIPTGEQPSVAPPGEVSACDLIAALGGDGTILKALHAAARTGTPVLGVAYGSLGALTTVDQHQLHTGLDRFAAGDWRPRRLPALAVRTAHAHIAWAINDLVLVRGGGTQLVLDVCVDGELYVRLAGDGIVVATALGSSAYSMAAGGSLLAAGTTAFVCTPVAMHGGCAPPLVVADDREVTLEVHPGHGGFYLDIDGFRVETEAQRFAVSSEHAYATLVALEDSRTGLPRLRERGLISDSPRVIGRDHRAPHVEGARHDRPQGDVEDVALGRARGRQAPTRLCRTVGPETLGLGRRDQSAAHSSIRYAPRSRMTSACRSTRLERAPTTTPRPVDRTPR